MDPYIFLCIILEKSPVQTEPKTEGLKTSLPEDSRTSLSKAIFSRGILPFT
jgi:hypothetical protein